jgi:broad specificity phosphatase PhoE
MLRRFRLLTLLISTVPSSLLSSFDRSAKCDELNTFRAQKLGPNDKIVHFIRHGESTMNLARGFKKEDEFHFDADLTEEGELQCIKLSEHMREKFRSVDLVVVSPLTRAVKTAMLCLPHLEGQVPWIALDCVRERMGIPAHRRRNISECKIAFPTINFDHISNDDDVWHTTHEGRELDADVALRAEEFVYWLSHRPEREVVVVSHGYFLRVLCLTVFGENQEKFQRFRNSELRSYVLSFPVDKCGSRNNGNTL